MFASTVISNGGNYVCPPAVIEEGSALSQDEKLGEQLMKFTVELIKEKTGPISEGKGCPFTLAKV
jgi:hypothetical protein